jgi:hypothetical protein
MNIILFQAGQKTLPRGKVPVVCVVLDAIDCKNPDANVLLRDPSGKVQSCRTTVCVSGIL